MPDVVNLSVSVPPSDSAEPTPTSAPGDTNSPGWRYRRKLFASGSLLHSSVVLPLGLLVLCVAAIRVGAPAASTPEHRPLFYSLLTAAGAVAFLSLAYTRRATLIESSRSTELLRIFVSEAPVSIAMFDNAMRYLAASRRWLTDYNLSLNDILGRSHYEIFPDIPERWKEAHRRGLAGTVVRCEEDLYSVEGAPPLWARWEVRPWSRLGTNGVDGVLIFVEDITERKHAEALQRELHAEREVEKALRLEAERQNQTKDDFFATLSHELRTPLNSILGWTYLAKRSNYDPDRIVQAVDAIERSAQIQSKLISDILDINRITAGRIALECKEASIHELLVESVERAIPEAQAKDISLVLEECPYRLRALVDRDRFHQCLWNLLANAIKFSPAGSQIQISSNLVASTVEISVSDGGIGIDPAILPRIFDRYMQADSSSTRVYGGLGLGLAITKHLIELHGGTVRAESTGKGQGSRFTITLPIIPQSSPSMSVDDSRPVRDRRALVGKQILVVDDHDDARTILSHILESNGAHVTTADSVDAGLHAARTAPFDIVLCDIGMPHKDGCDFTQSFRTFDYHTPVIALSAHASTSMAERALHAGFTVFLSKPVDPEQLVEQIAIATLGQSHEVC